MHARPVFTIRPLYLIAEDVLGTAVAWWERRGFLLRYPVTEDGEEGVVGTYEWWRDDDPVFEGAPYEAGNCSELTW